MVAVELGGVTAVPRGRLIGWLGLVGSLTALNFAARYGGAGDTDQSDALYRYDTAIGGAFVYLALLGVTLLLARGLPKREVFALRAPSSWGSAVSLAAVGVVAVFAVNAALVAGLGLSPGEEQGFTPDSWQPEHAGAYAANVVVVGLFAPVVEELLYRGFGYWALAGVAGATVALIGTAVLFGLAHGLVIGLLPLVTFGLVAGYLRRRTGSIYPSMVMHMLFNSAALILAVTVEAEL